MLLEITYSTFKTRGFLNDEYVYIVCIMVCQLLECDMENSMLYYGRQKSNSVEIQERVFCRVYHTSSLQTRIIECFLRLLFALELQCRERSKN